jgi:hypothetical protein
MTRAMAYTAGALLVALCGLSACNTGRDNAYGDRDCPFAHPCTSPGSTPVDSEQGHKDS